jgi:hypothetical protein
VDPYDDRAGLEVDLNSHKGGLRLAVIRTRRLAAHRLVVLVMQLAPNLLIWAGRRLTTQATRLVKGGIVRLVQEV